MSRGIGEKSSRRRLRSYEDSRELSETAYVLWCLKQLAGQIFIFGDLAPFFSVWTLTLYLATGFNWLEFVF
jgi:hypothetical protein